MSTNYATSGGADALSFGAGMPPDVPPVLGTALPLTLYGRDSSEAISIPPSAYTWAGFRQWAVSDEFPEHGKITLCGGELVVDMSPESFEEQGAVKTEICRVLTQLVRELKLGHYRIHRTLISNQSAGLSSEPDSVLITPASIKAGRVTFVPEVGRPQSSKEIVGTVDWVLEIVSPSSRRKDAQLLRAAYFAAGIPEYWLIDPTGEANLDFQILAHGEGGYVAVARHDNWQASPTFGCAFRLTRERDDDGYWQYTLDVKESA